MSDLLEVLRQKRELRDSLRAQANAIEAELDAFARAIGTNQAPERRDGLRAGSLTSRALVLAHERGADGLRISDISGWFGSDQYRNQRANHVVRQLVERGALERVARGLYVITASGAQEAA